MGRSFDRAHIDHADGYSVLVRRSELGFQQVPQLDSVSRWAPLWRRGHAFATEPEHQVNAVSTGGGVAGIFGD